MTQPLNHLIKLNEFKEQKNERITHPLNHLLIQFRILMLFIFYQIELQEKACTLRDIELLIHFWLKRQNLTICYKLDCLKITKMFVI